MITVAYWEGETWDTPGAKKRELFLATMPTKWRVSRQQVETQHWATYYEIDEDLVGRELVDRFPPDRLW
jgi:hypothetical protein